MPEDANASDVFSPSAVQRIEDFFANKKNAEISAVSQTSIDDLTQALALLESVEEFKARFVGLTGEWLASTLDDSNQELIERLVAGMGEVNQQFKDFGSEFFHGGYLEYDIRDDFAALEIYLGFFKSIADAQVQSLISLGRKTPY